MVGAFGLFLFSLLLGVSCVIALDSTFQVFHT